MLTEAELDYYITTLNQQNNLPKQKRSVKLAYKHLNKTVYTMRVLMRLMCISFFFDHIYRKSKREESVEQAVLLMVRCKKLFAALAQLSTVFKLTTLRTNCSTKTDFAMKQSVNKRLLAAVTSFLDENAIFPLRFVFEKKNLLIALY